MFKLESKDPVFKVLISFFTLIYIVGATVFLLHFKPVTEVPAIFLCVSLWIFAAMYYFAGTRSSLDSINDKVSVENTASKDQSLTKILVGFFYTIGCLVVFIAANTELFFFIIIVGYVFYMATVYLWAYLLTRMIRYFIRKKKLLKSCQRAD